MPTLTIPNAFVNNVSTVDATTMNANFNQVATIVNGIDNVNIGTLGIYASQVKPTSVANATFGGSQIYTFPAAIIPSAGSPQFLSGTGAPSANLPNASLFMRYDGGTNSQLYVNTSGASSSGTTWSALVTGSAVYSAQKVVALAPYSSPGTESDGTPVAMVTATLTLPSSSPGTNNNWLTIVSLYLQCDATASTPHFGIGTSTAGSAVFSCYGSSINSATHNITGGSCVSDSVLASTVFVARETFLICEYISTQSNSTALSFTGLIGGNNFAASTKIGGRLAILAFPN